MVLDPQKRQRKAESKRKAKKDTWVYIDTYGIQQDPIEWWERESAAFGKLHWEDIDFAWWYWM